MEDVADWREECFERPWYRFALELLPQKKGKILDLGSGACEFSRMMRAKGFQVVCTDASKKYVEHAIRLGFEARQADFDEKLPFESKCFDGVVALEVIEHIVNAEQLISEVSRALKRNGWLILSTPNIAWLPYRMLALLGKPPFKKGYHVRFFTKKTLEKLLNSAGLEIEIWNSFTPVPYIHRLTKSPLWVRTKRAQSMLAQDLVVKCKKRIA